MRFTWTKCESAVRNTNERNTWCGGTCRNRAIDTTTAGARGRGSGDDNKGDNDDADACSLREQCPVQ